MDVVGAKGERKAAASGEIEAVFLKRDRLGEKREGGVGELTRIEASTPSLKM